MDKNAQFLPRFIRLRDAPRYLGMDKNRFCYDVRPYITEIPIGKRGIAFDRLDLDNWADYYKQTYGHFNNTNGKTFSNFILEQKAKLDQNDFEKILKKIASKKRR